MLGVAFGIAVQDITGDIVLQNAPTQTAASAALRVPTNLGACIKASRILEIEPLLASNGVKPPAGYNMRTK